jgi:hypothetical protein
VTADILSEALRGWRAWQVLDGRDGPVLASWWVDAHWPARRPLESRCAMHGPHPRAHHACGIHAFTTREQALDYLDRSAATRPLLFVRRPERALGLVVGRVSGWGRSVAHTRGWRSQFAYPYDLFVLRGGRALVRALSDRYAVEASLFPSDQFHTTPHPPGVP